MFDTLDTLLRSVGALRTIAHEPGPVIIELLLIGLSVNWCASVLQGTRGTRPLRGVLTLLVVATLVVNTLAMQFGWLRVALLYRFFVFGLAFIALIAFQPELRRAVIRAGDVGFRRRGPRQSKIVTSLVQAARFLSKNRYGGLIAIQRVVDLTAWAEKGTLINAEVSANLLNTIFFPNSPLHDLGVVLAGNRVVAANCQFPVAESDEVGAALGSRHLAAVGMSYESDALVLVVSEETGTISLADNGKLARFASADELADELTRRLAGQVAGIEVGKKRSAGLPSAAPRVLRRMLVVVPLTFVIWIVANQWTQTDSAPVGVQVLLKLNDPQRVVDVLDPQAGVFQVIFRGTAREIDALRDHTGSNPLRVDWVPDRYPVGRDQRSAAGLLDSLPAIRSRGLSVKQVSPEILEFRVHELVTATVPVTASTGAARIENARFTPDQVQVTMRKDDLEQLLPTDRVLRLPLEERLRDVAAGQTITLARVRVPDRIKGFPVVSVEPKEIDVSLQIAGQQVKQRLGPIPVRMQASPEVFQSYEVEAVDLLEWQIEVEVEGDESRVQKLTAQDVHAFVSIPSDLVSRTPVFRCNVEFYVPEGVTVLSQRSVQVRVAPRRAELKP